MTVVPNDDAVQSPRKSSAGTNTSGVGTGAASGGGVGVVSLVDVPGPLHPAASAMMIIRGFTAAAYRGMLSAMRRAVPLVLVSCAAKPATAPVEHSAASDDRDPLGLLAGRPWTFTGEHVTDDGATPITWQTELVDLELEPDGKRRYTVRGWPGFQPADETRVVLDDGLITLAGDPWLRIEPAYDAPPCEETYCWTIEPRDDGSVEVWYRTGPDVTRYGFRRGFGVTDFLYHHNGTTEDLELQRK